jgi:hypothetical protein
MRHLTRFRSVAALVAIGVLMGAGVTAGIFLLARDDGGSASAAQPAGRIAGPQLAIRITPVQRARAAAAQKGAKEKPRKRVGPQPLVIRDIGCSTCSRETPRIWFNRAETKRVADSDDGASWALDYTGLGPWLTPLFVPQTRTAAAGAYAALGCLGLQYHSSGGYLSAWSWWGSRCS